MSMANLFLISIVNSHNKLIISVRFL